MGCHAVFHTDYSRCHLQVVMFSSVLGKALEDVEAVSGDHSHSLCKYKESKKHLYLHQETLLNAICDVTLSTKRFFIIF